LAGWHPPDLPPQPTAVAALRDQLDTFWSRALAGYRDVVDEPGSEET
jgi:hypothetical protein